MTGAVRAVLRATVALDRAGLQGRDGLRAALGVGVPLLVGVAVDRPLDGLAAAGGAFSAGFAVLATGYRTRLSAVLLATLGTAVSTFVGAVVGDRLGLLAATVAVWGFAAGMLVSLGAAAGVVGLQACIGLLIVTQFPMPVQDGLGRALLVLLGGLVQVVLLLTVWPLRRSPEERRALGGVYRSLAAYAASLPAGRPAPPDSVPLAAARAALRDPQPFLRDEHVLVLQGLHDQAERLRTTLAALALVRARLVDVPSRAGAVATLDELAGQTSALLREIAAAAQLPRSAARAEALADIGPHRAPDTWAPLVAAARALRDEAAAAGPAQGHVGASLLGELERLATTLLGHLEAVTRLSAATGGPLRPRVRSSAWRDAVPTLRAHLTLRSAAFRHALRLSATLAVATALSGLLPSAHRYWLPLTALVVLKPDFRSTFSRGLGRILGTLVGAALASGIAATLRPGPLVLALLVVLAAWAGYTFLFANYALFGLSVTAFVVFLLSFAGLPAQSAVPDRVLATVLGGALALSAYAVWPTWERVRLPEQLARLLEAQGRYGAALLRSYADPEDSDGPGLEELRAAARLARTNAEASVAQARDEPAGRSAGLPLEQATAVVQAVRDFALAALALQAHLPEARPVGVREPLLQLADELGQALGRTAAALRAGWEPGRSPPLVQAQHRLQQALAERVAADPGTALEAAVLDVEAAQLVEGTRAAARALRRSSLPRRTAPARTPRLRRRPR